MKDYEFLPSLMLRTPLYSMTAARCVQNALRDEQFKAALLLASPSFFREIEKKGFDFRLLSTLSGRPWRQPYPVLFRRRHGMSKRQTKDILKALVKYTSTLILGIYWCLFSQAQHFVVESQAAPFPNGSSVAVTVIHPLNSAFDYASETFTTDIRDGSFRLEIPLATSNFYYMVVAKNDGKKVSANLFLAPKSCQLVIADSLLQQVNVRGNDVFYDFEMFSNQLTEEPVSKLFSERFSHAISAHKMEDPVVRSALDSLADLRQKAWAEISLKWIKEHPLSEINSYVAYTNVFGKGHDGELKKLFDDFKMPATYNCWDRELMYSLFNLTEGCVAPGFQLPDTSGAEVSLSSFKGRIVLLDFWASWCVPCRKTHPFLQRIYRQFSGKGFEIVSVSLDDKKEVWTKAIGTDRLPWCQVSDLGGWQSVAARKYAVKSIPANFLIDGTGKIIARDVFGEDLLHLLTRLMEQER